MVPTSRVERSHGENGWMTTGPKNGQLYYLEVVSCHYLHCHPVDDHNNKQHSLISLEVVWATKYWPSCMFAFLLSIMEVNVNLATTCFCKQQQMSQIKFQKLWVKTLICNNHYNKETDKIPDKKHKKQETSHCLIILPIQNNLQGHELSPQTVYIHNISAQPAKRVCTYCLCSPGIYQCAESLTLS